MEVNGLTYYRKRAGYSQISVAKYLEINPSRLSRLENGWAKPTDKELEQFSKLYESSIDDLKSTKEVYK